MNHALKHIAKRLETASTDKDKWALRADAILAGCNEVQRRLILDRSKYKSIRCPRRSGKSFGMTSLVLEHGERHPNSRILVISLTLKSTKENYWSSAPGGIFAQDYMYSLNLSFNHTELTWTHENGSRGRLAGAETKADIEYFRGAAAEADVIIIDECKSFAPDLLSQLIVDVIKPGLMTRRGKLIMGGTPGSIPEGPFYAATEPTNRVKWRNPDTGEEEERTTCIPYTGRVVSQEDGRWSLHSWTIQENTAKKHQWEEALIIKSTDYNNDDLHPVWRREYLGEWVTDSDELVYAFAKCKKKGMCTWIPDPNGDSNGLNPEHGPWRLVMGLDFGYEDSCAIVVSAWSDTRQELKHVYDWKSPHLTIDDFTKHIHRAIKICGKPDVIVGDAGALGKMIVETINQRYALGIIPAEKKDKYDHIELVNSDFHSNRIKVILGSGLDQELSALQWDLSKDKKLLIRTGKLREDPSCENHLSDAFLYSWRYTYHFWAKERKPEVIQGSAEWWATRERVELENYRKKLANLQEIDYNTAQFQKLKKSEWFWRNQ